MISLIISRLKVRACKRSTIVIPKAIRERLGMVEGMLLELYVEDDKTISKTRDLWSELRMYGRRSKVDIDGAERELDDEEYWMKRLRP